MMNVQDIVQNRYSTKSFDASKKISAEDFAQIEAALRYSPSSVNIQPWHFVITDNEAGKARVAKSAENFPYNLPKIINASHVIVFAARCMPMMTIWQACWNRKIKTDVLLRPKISKWAIMRAALSWVSTATKCKTKPNGCRDKFILIWALPCLPPRPWVWMPFRWKGWIWLFWIKNLVWLKKVIVLLPLLHWAIALKMILMPNCRNHVWKTR